MAKVEIKQEGCGAEVLVDGQSVANCVSGLTVRMDAQCLPEVTLQLVPLEAGLKLEDAVVRFPDMPEALERALLAHLRGKYKCYATGAYVIGVDESAGTDTTAMATMVRGLITEVAEVAPVADPMEAVRAMVKRHGGGSGG